MKMTDFDFDILTLILYVQLIISHMDICVTGCWCLERRCMLQI